MFINYNKIKEFILLLPRPLLASQTFWLYEFEAISLSYFATKLLSLFYIDFHSIFSTRLI